MSGPRVDLPDALFDRAAAGDVTGVMAAVRTALVSGFDAAEVLDALAAVQRRVGERWYRNEWDVAGEHAATAVVDAALAALEAELVVEPSADAPTVVVACPEGEWHALPGRLLAADLRRRGAAVSFLGASMPAQHMASHARRVRADVVALSTATALNLISTSVAIDAVHEVGVPVVVGGGAFASGSRRAAALGADAHADGAAALLELDLARTRPVGTPAARRERSERVLRMQLDRPAVVGHAFQALQARIPQMRRFDDQQLARTREDLDYIARYAEAAHLVDDDTLMDELIEWLQPLLAIRGVPSASLAAGLDVLTDAATTPELRAAAVRARAHLATLGDASTAGPVTPERSSTER